MSSCLHVFLTTAESTARENTHSDRIKEHQAISVSLFSQIAASKQMYSFPFLLTEALPLSICPFSPIVASSPSAVPFFLRRRRLGILA